VVGLLGDDGVFSDSNLFLFLSGEEEGSGEFGADDDGEGELLQGATEIRGGDAEEGECIKNGGEDERGGVSCLPTGSKKGNIDGRGKVSDCRSIGNEGEQPRGLTLGLRGGETDIGRRGRESS